MPYKKRTTYHRNQIRPIEPCDIFCLFCRYLGPIDVVQSKALARRFLGRCPLCKSLNYVRIVSIQTIPDASLVQEAFA